MKLNLLPPALISYTDNLPEGTAAEARACYIRIRPKYQSDEGLLAHELEHVKQAWLGLFIGHALLYRFLRAYRLWAEVKAYRAQIRFGITLESAARRLMSPKYNFGINFEQAVAALMG